MHGGARYEGGRGKRLKSRREAADRRESGGNPGGEVVLLRSLPRLWPKSTLLRYLLELLSTRDGSLNIAERCNRRSSYNRSHSRGDVFSRMIRKTRVVSSWINKSDEISRSIDRTLSFKSGSFERFRSKRFFGWKFERILWRRFFCRNELLFFCIELCLFEGRKYEKHDQFEKVLYLFLSRNKSKEWKRVNDLIKKRNLFKIIVRISLLW